MRTILVGYGRFGSVYAARATAAGLDLVGVVEVANVAPGVPVFRSVRDAVQATRPELVIVATPPRFHATLALEALVLGADVLLAKPGALSVDEADRVTSTAWNLGRRVVVDYTPRMSPAWDNLRQVPGPIRTARFTRRGSARLQDCGALWDLAPHDVALALELDPTDLVEKVTARAWYDARVEEPVGAFVFLEHASGRSSRLEVDWVAADTERRVEVVTDDETVVWDQSLEEPGEDNVTRALRRAALPATDDSELFREVVRIVEAADADIYHPRSRPTTNSLAYSG